MQSDKPYMGFGMDFIEELQRRLGFEYTLNISRDGQYGTLDPHTKEWNGMIRELLEEVSRPITPLV